jgi:hypothetical protein
MMRGLPPSLMALSAEHLRQMAPPAPQPSIQDALLAIAAEEQARPERRLPARRDRTPLALSLGAMTAGHLADILSTHAALKRPGVSEGNSAVYGENPSLGRLIGTKAAVAVPSAFALAKLYEKHPKLAQALGYGVGAFGAILAARNSQVGK